MKVEVGKIYRNREGAWVGPVKSWEGKTHPYRIGRRTYREDGRVSAYAEHPGDLVDWPVEAQPIDQASTDPVNHPPHYLKHPSGVECIAITEHMNFCRGNAIKYIWRADDKGDVIENLEKAKWYLEREIARLKAISLA